MSLEQQGDTPNKSSELYPERRSHSVSITRTDSIDALRSGVLSFETDELAAKSSFDPGRILDALLRRWYWILFGAITIGVLGSILAYATAPYLAVVQLIRTPNASRPTSDKASALSFYEHPVESLIQVMKSPAFLRRVIASSQLSLASTRLAADSELLPVETGDLINIRLRGKNPESTVRLINAYADEAIAFAQELKGREINESSQSVERELSSLDEQLKSLDGALVQFQEKADSSGSGKDVPAQLQESTDLQVKSQNLRSKSAILDLQIQSLIQEIANQTPTLVAAREALNQALLHFTVEHPKIKELRAAVVSLEGQIERDAQAFPKAAPSGSPLVNALLLQVIDLRKEKIALIKQQEEIDAARSRVRLELTKSPDTRNQFARAKAQSQFLRERRQSLLHRQQELQLAGDAKSGYYQVLDHARIEDLSSRQKTIAAVVFGGVGGLFGLLAMGAVILIVEASDNRIRSKADLRRATRLPILATLGNLAEMTDEQREQWAFKTLIMLRSKLGGDRRGAFICGFTSSSFGEGRSTCVQLLADAASRQGHSVLTISADVPVETMTPTGQAGQEDQPASGSLALCAPLELPKVVSGQGSQSIIHVPIPGFVWNLEQRQQWREAVQQWRSIENLMVLVDLPPASTAEAILLAEDLPTLVWICGKNMTNAPETHSQIETLRHSRNNLLGTIFNHDIAPAWKRRFGHLVGGVLLASALLSNNLSAQDAAVSADPKLPNKKPVVSLSVSSPSQMADWQRHLTVGPGDVLDISLYEQADSLRPGISIGPDGRLNYLQARDFPASGLTIDELRTNLETVLSKFYLSPRVVIVPVAYNSKKYFLMGNVVQKGVFPLDRPLTIVEAIAKAQGFQTAILQSNTLVMADLSKSFLIRKQPDGIFKRMPVDFEALFLRGDLTENQVMAPDDYLYFPPLNLQEVYVLGEVVRPGVAPYLESQTALRAIVARGGFTDKAYRSKILVVRGSLNHPQTFMVDASALLAGKGLDFPLAARDIVYVHRKPWFKVEELLQLAVTDFLRAAVITYGGTRVGPFITKPVF